MADDFLVSIEKLIMAVKDWHRRWTGSSSRVAFLTCSKGSRWRSACAHAEEENSRWVSASLVKVDKASTEADWCPLHALSFQVLRGDAINQQP